MDSNETILLKDILVVLETVKEKTPSAIPTRTLRDISNRINTRIAMLDRKAAKLSTLKIFGENALTYFKNKSNGNTTHQDTTGQGS